VPAPSEAGSLPPNETAESNKEVQGHRRTSKFELRVGGATATSETRQANNADGSNEAAKRDTRQRKQSDEVVSKEVPKSRYELRTHRKENQQIQANVTEALEYKSRDVGTVSMSLMLGCVFGLIAATEKTVSKETALRMEDRVRRKIPPKSMAEILVRSDRKVWETATVGELMNHNGLTVNKAKRNETFNKLVDEDAFDPENDKIHRLIWAYEYRSSGPKARLCIDGSKDEEDIDFEKMYATSSVVKMSTTRMAMSYAAHHGMTEKQHDVKCAYLCGTLPETTRVFARAPYGLNQVPGAENFETNEIVRIKTSAYGLKQSGKIWYDTLVARLNSEEIKAKGYEFKMFEQDPCAFICFKDGQPLIVTLFVDDLRIYFKNQQHYDDLFKHLEDEYVISDRTDSEQYLGMNIVRHGEHGYHLSCKRLIEKIELKYELENSVKKSSPMVDRKYSYKDLVPLKQDGKETAAFKTYRSILGAVGFIYVACRPDIGFACNRLQQNMHNPLYGHWKDLLHLVAYLRATKDEGITITGDWDENDNMINGFSDSSYGDCEDKSSSYGYIIYWGSDIILYKASTTTTIVRSSCEAELYAVDCCLLEMIPLIRTLKDFNINLKCLPNIHCDNSAAIMIIESDKVVNRVKHTEIQIAYLRQMERRGIYRMVKIHTDNNCADILTKALFVEKYEDIRGKLYDASRMYEAEAYRIAHPELSKKSKRKRDENM